MKWDPFGPHEEILYATLSDDDAANIAALKQDLVMFGWHAVDCQWDPFGSHKDEPGAGCSCGWREAAERWRLEQTPLRLPGPIQKMRFEQSMDENNWLREQLGIYGGHWESCTSYADDQCDCGWQEVQERLVARKLEEKRE